ncbi:prolyl oligopeptidase family serine peptidase [Akkermansiaceae bacterium]|nr:prolyl oligopeptidase family serine peptidase [Akkermansiaceae bacterium]
MISRAFGILLLFSLPALAQGSKEDYERAADLGKRFSGKVFRDRVDPHWIEGTEQFWYRIRTGPKDESFVLIDATTGTRKEADKLEQLLPDQKASKNGSTVKVLSAPRTHKTTGGSTTITFLNKTKEPVQFFWLGNLNSPTPYGKAEPGKQIDQHTYAGHVWIAKGPNNKTLGVFEATAKPGLAVIDGSWKPGEINKERPKRRHRGNTSPDGKWRAEIQDHQVALTDLTTKKTTILSKAGTEDDPFTGQFYWSPDSSKLVALQRKTPTKRQVHIVESSPKDQAQPKLKTFTYVKPGDAIDHPRPRLFDLATQKKIPLDDKLFADPWSLSDFNWDDDSSQFTFLYNQRGHQVLRVVAIDAKSGQSSSLVADTPETFVCYSSKKYYHRIEDKKEIIWMSERDGWNHLYLFDSKTGSLKNQITKGHWVVRKVERIDHEKRQIWFQAGGIHPDQDPYHVHYARINFDGTNLVKLTTGDGTHNIDYSPDGKFFIDTYSRVDLPPVTELRRTKDGSLVKILEKGDASKLVEAGWKATERFVAKGRDGQTDIYGIIHRPSNFDPEKKYPVIEQIYAGPHSAHVPKQFSSRGHAMAEIGFIVVQIDGMGTSLRSKAFHDVCWKNIGDAGFPDRVLWIKAAAKDRPWMDLDRVGIYGGSAGGQNAMRALIAHHDFYKVAVADCGCHDNAMDKIWWNEQWMGYPLDEHYKSSSNTAQAHRLEGKLLLIVGELDTNVDPASTMQVVNALVKADKDFDLLVIPGAGHGAAGTKYGKRRQKDYFVRHLLGVEPRH